MKPDIGINIGSSGEYGRNRPATLTLVSSFKSSLSSSTLAGAFVVGRGGMTI